MRCLHTSKRDVAQSVERENRFFLALTLVVGLTCDDAILGWLERNVES